MCKWRNSYLFLNSEGDGDGDGEGACQRVFGYNSSNCEDTDIFDELDHKGQTSYEA